MSSEDSSSNPMPLDPGENFPLNIKVKQEKITPPPSPTPTTTNSDAALILSSIDNILDTALSAIKNEKNDEKKSIEPIKTSNEILAELFQVFNSAPPTAESLNAEHANEATSTSSKKKKKHKKHKKKHKKKGRSSSDDDDDEDDDGGSNGAEENSSEKSRKHKKVKKEKKSKRKRDESQTKDEKNVEKRKIKKEKLDDEIIVKKESERRSSSSKRKTKTKDKDLNDLEMDMDAYEKKLLEESKSSSTKGSSKSLSSTIHKSSRIVIKDLKNSAIYEETMSQVKAKEKERERRHAAHEDGELSSMDERNSSISLSDEETYLRNKYSHSSNRERDHSRERDQNEIMSAQYYGAGSSRSGDTTRNHYRNDRDRYYDRDHRHSSAYGNDRRDIGGRRTSYNSRRRSRSRSRRRDNSEDRIDKKRLLEIARKNAILMLKNGTLPGTQNLAPDAKEKVLAKMRYGGKSVDELTEFCKKLSNGESSGYLSNVSADSDHDMEGNEKAFNHPFVLKDRGPIVMNIKNSTPIPPKSAEQTKAILLQFPVSSGQHHRANESEWVPVPPPPKKPPPPPKRNLSKNDSFTDNLNEFRDFVAASKSEKSTPTATKTPAANSANVPDDDTTPKPTEPAIEVNIFKEASGGKDLDVTSIISNRLNAMRKLQDNPLDSEALKTMYNTQKDMSAWANSKFVPGQFTGSTGANVLTTKELQSGFQAWAKRDQLISSAPVSGGMGMHLLQKMGWKPGEGLGKEKNGSLQPLLLEVKLDKKGLVANVEEDPHAPRRRRPVNVAQVKQTMESKHPVSLLGEIAAKRRWILPLYEIVSENGPHHSRKFKYKVSMNNNVFEPPILSNTKKEAKAVAARFCLQQMGILK